MKTSTIRVSYVLLATLIAAACSTTATPRSEPVTEPHLRESLFLSAAPAPANRSCGVAASDLPPIDQVVDSAAVMDAFRDIGSSTALLSIGYDGFGELEFVRVLEAGDDQAGQLAEITGRHARSQPMEPKMHLWRLKVESGPDARIHIGHSEICAPELVNRETVSQALSSIRIDGARTVVVMYQVGPDGRVIESRVTRRSGNTTLDRLGQDVAEDLRFLPGLKDGIPSVMWAQIPINYDVRF
ncbi:MAG: energy transducer TonB [Longimicrobiales bacterium]|nr:energy transducer TonB [Longimicrobiales bacterium]